MCFPFPKPNCGSYLNTIHCFFDVVNHPKSGFFRWEYVIAKEMHQARTPMITNPAGKSTNLIYQPCNGGLSKIVGEPQKTLWGIHPAVNYHYLGGILCGQFGVRSLKLTHLKMSRWKRKYIYTKPILGFYVSFLGCTTVFWKRTLQMP